MSAKISIACDPGDPEIGSRHENGKWRTLVGWNHQIDTEDGLKDGKIWCWVSEPPEKFQVYDQQFNRGGQGEVRFCGVANFTMIRLFHPYWSVGYAGARRVPIDMVFDDKKACRANYHKLIRKHRLSLGLPVEGPAEETGTQVLPATEVPLPIGLNVGQPNGGQLNNYYHQPSAIFPPEEVVPGGSMTGPMIIDDQELSVLDGFDRLYQSILLDNGPGTRRQAYNRRRSCSPSRATRNGIETPTGQSPSRGSQGPVGSIFAEPVRSSQQRLNNMLQPFQTSGRDSGYLSLIRSSNSDPGTPRTLGLNPPGFNPFADHSQQGVSGELLSGVKDEDNDYGTQGATLSAQQEPSSLVLDNLRERQPELIIIDDDDSDPNATESLFIPENEVADLADDNEIKDENQNESLRTVREDSGFVSRMLSGLANNPIELD